MNDSKKRKAKKSPKLESSSCSKVQFDDVIVKNDIVLDGNLNNDENDDDDDVEQPLVPYGMLPSYMADAFSELYEEDGLICLGKGLQWLMLLASFIRYYTSELSDNDCNENDDLESNKKKCANNNNNNKLAGQRVQRLLVTMLLTQQKDNNNNIIIPDLHTYNIALSVYARAGEVQTCERLIYEMYEHYKNGYNTNILPDTYSYNIVLNAYAKAGMYEQAESFVNYMYQQYIQHTATTAAATTTTSSTSNNNNNNNNNNNFEHLRPTPAMFTSILDAYAHAIVKIEKCNNKDDAMKLIHKAQYVYEKMLNLSNYGILAKPIDTMAYNMMLTCYLRYCTSIDTFPKVNTTVNYAEQILYDMKHHSSKFAKPNFTTYSLLIQIWLSSRVDGIQRVKQLLIESLHHITDPTGIHCIVVGLCRANQPILAKDYIIQICYNIFEQKQHNNNNNNNTSNFSNKSQLQQQQQQQPVNMGTFGTIMAYWSKNGKVRRQRQQQQQHQYKQVQELINSMEYFHKKGILHYGPDRLMYMTLIRFLSDANRERDAYSVLNKMKQLAKNDNNMYPDILAYDNVLQACSRGGTSNPYLGEKILNEIITDYKTFGTVKPTARCFNHVLTAWARYNGKQPKSINRVEALFNKMKVLHHEKDDNDNIQCFDDYTYNAYLNCLAESGIIEKVEKAELILREMIKDETIIPNPTIVTYGCIIKGWVRVNQPNRAEIILREMYEKYINNNNNIAMKPQIRHFYNVINCWSSQKQSNNSNNNAIKERIDSIIELMHICYPDHDNIVNGIEG